MKRIYLEGLNDFKDIYVFERDGAYHFKYRCPKQKRWVRYSGKHFNNGFPVRNTKLVIKIVNYIDEKMKAGLNPKDIIRIKSGMGLEDFKDEYINYIRKEINKPSANTDEYLYKYLIMKFGNKGLNDFTDDDLEYYKTKRKKEVSEATIQHELVVLRSILRVYKKLYKIKKLDLPKLPKLNAERRRIPELISDEEFLKIVEVADDSLKKLCYIMKYTSCRPSEATRLKGKDIRQFLLKDNKHYLVITDTKTGKGERALPINDELWDVIKDTKPDEYIVNYNGEPYLDSHVLTTKFRRAKKRAGITKRISLYSLRHTAITYLVINSDIKTAQQFAGHTRITMTEKYTHLIPNRLIDASDSLKINKKGRL